MGRSPRCYIPSFVKIGPPVLEKKILKGFYHIWAWRASWSCDMDHLYKLSFPLSKEAPHKIWLWLAKRFQRRRLLKMWTDNDGRTDDGRRIHGYPISSPESLRLRWANNNINNNNNNNNKMIIYCSRNILNTSWRLNSTVSLTILWTTGPWHFPRPCCGEIKCYIPTQFTITLQTHIKRSRWLQMHFSLAAPMRTCLREMLIHQSFVSPTPPPP